MICPQAEGKEIILATDEHGLTQILYSRIQEQCDVEFPGH